jgi:hypothetical protein
MKRSIKYVGLDVHQATTVTTVREETGRVIARTILPTEAAPGRPLENTYQRQMWQQQEGGAISRHCSGATSR